MDDLTEEEKFKLGVDNNKDIMVIKVVIDDMPTALKLKKVEEEAEEDPTYQELKWTGHDGKKSNNPDLAPYAHVWKELTVKDGLVLQGERIVVPDRDPGEGNGTLRQCCVELGHKGHQGAAGTKWLLRLWWPGMDRQAKARVASCLQCHASTPTHQRDPLQPTMAPSQPMEHLSGDHWGPTPDKEYILVVIDLLTRYPGPRGSNRQEHQREGQHPST